MLKDERLERLAKILLQYSLGLSKGDIFQVNASISARPLVEAVFRESACFRSSAGRTMGSTG